MQQHFRVSPPSVHQMVLNLERAGLIRRQPGVARSIELLVAPEKLPTLSLRQSGDPETLIEMFLLADKRGFFRKCHCSQASDGR